MRQLEANDFDVTHDTPVDAAPVVIINTCGFIESAKQQSIETILQFADAKQDGRVERVYVTGCLSERYRDELEQEIPDVDAYFGTRELPKLLKTLNADYRKELVGERLLSTPQHYAYLKIAEGCDRPCAFCAIPLMRGEAPLHPHRRTRQAGREPGLSRGQGADPNCARPHLLWSRLVQRAPIGPTG